MGGSGLRADTLWNKYFGDPRAFRIYDGPTECTNGLSPRRFNRRMGDTCSTQDQFDQWAYVGTTPLRSDLSLWTKRPSRVDSR